MDSSEDELLSLNSSDSDSDPETKISKAFVHSKPGSRNYKSPTSSSDNNCSQSINFRDSDKDSNNASDTTLSPQGFSDSQDDNSTTRPGTSRNSMSQNTEIVLSDTDDENNDIGIAGTSEVSNSALNESNSREDNGTGTRSGYGLRRKRKINYNEMENIPEMEDSKDNGKQNLKKEVFDIFSLSVERIRKITRNPELVDNYTKCKICFFDGTESSKILAVGMFFEKCGHQFESMFVQMRSNEDNFNFLKDVFKSAESLGKLDYRSSNREEALSLLKLLKAQRDSNKLPSLHSLKLVSLSGHASLTEKHMAILSDLKIELQRLELGDALWEDVKCSTIQTFLEKQKLTLETLIIHGGFRGDTEKERILIKLPKMEKLSTLCICPNYGFVSEIKNPYSKKARVVTLGSENIEPYKIAISFSSDMPALQNLVLGNLIEVEDLLFSTLRKMTEFKCGSYWNLNITFPPEGSRQSLRESAITQLQFPDALKDPSFPVRVAKHFPNLRKVWMFLPSVPVLRAFFKAFENSNLEELYLKTQFDFESTMESCLLPRLSDVLRRSQATQTLMETLKEYKHFDEYVRYYNIELPVEADQLMEGHSAGIRALKNLKVLHLEHVPRILLIPNPEDERKWYDHNFKYLTTTFGYERYPLNYRCHKEILSLDLSEYIWKNIQVNSEFTDDFYQAGFVDITDSQVFQETAAFRRFEEEDLFIPVQRSRTSATNVKIMPSMLFPDVKIKPESS